MDILKPFKDMIADESSAAISANLAKSVVDEVEKLRAENARLQSVIDAANAQEPIARGYKNSITGSCSDLYWLADAPEGETNLYARPIPAQQSPAVAVPDDNPNEWVIEKLSYHKFERNDLNIDGCLNYLESEWKEIQGRTTRQLVMQILELLAAAPSPRITEQDAREIAKSYFAFNNTREFTEKNFKCWLKAYGRALLDKLKEVKNGK